MQTAEMPISDGKKKWIYKSDPRALKKPESFIMNFQNVTRDLWRLCHKF